MKKVLQNSKLLRVIERLFADDSQRVMLEPEQVLMREGEFNDKLYLVRSGELKGYVFNPDGSRYELFNASQDMFVGLYSFFSRTFKSSATVIAEKRSEVAYIVYAQAENDASFFEQFMPVLVTDLVIRQQREQEFAFEREKALLKLIQSEKLASLGQMAAGIAHELNNAIAVLERNTQWLHDHLATILEQRNREDFVHFQRGFTEGRTLSSREVRAQAKDLLQRFALSEESARKLAEANLSGDELEGASGDLDSIADIINYYWEIGATLYDMAIAAHHAAYVVKSVKLLATEESEAATHVDVNGTINEAIALLRSPLRKIQVEFKLSDIPAIAANSGELVQVWTNLINNAIESMAGAGIEDGRLTVRSSRSKHAICVTVEDNGPGIPKEILPKIFQPNFTTKEKGLQFGLGLGLTIVERIVNSYGGEIEVKSKAGATKFTVKLPI